METLEQEKILLHEETGPIVLIDQQIERDLPRVRAMVNAYKAVGIFPELSNLNTLETFRGQRPAEIEKSIRSFLVDQSDTNLNGVNLSRSKVAELIDLPEQTTDFIKACSIAFSTQSFDMANFELRDGQIMVNSAIVERMKDRHRFYARTPAQLERLSELRNFADMINAAAEKFGKGHFTGKEIPLLEGGFIAGKDENGFSHTGKLLGSYRPSWRAVLRAK